MTSLIMFTLLLVSGSTYGNYQVLESSSLTSFLITFRQVLLEKVAVEVNVSLDIAELLNNEVEDCKPLLQLQSDACKECARNTCQREPSFEDYLALANPYLYLEGPLDNIGDKIDDAIDLVGGKASGFYNYVKNIGESFGSEEFYANIFADLNNALHLDEVANFFDGLLDDILNLDDLATDLWDDIFGKRRKRSDLKFELYRALTKMSAKHRLRSTEIDAELRECMEQCSSCLPLLKPTKQEIVTEVCGDAIEILNATLVSRVWKMQTVYNNTLDTVNVIVDMLELNPATYNFMTGVVSEVYVTAYMDGEYTRYQTGVPYKPLEIDFTAREMGLEYWEVFDV